MQGSNRRRTWQALCAVLLPLAVSNCGCLAPPPAPPAPDAGTKEEAPSIDAFAADRSAVTSGEAFDGSAAQGTVALSWQVQGAALVELYDGDQPVSLASCAPAEGAAGCHEAGTLVVRPTESATFRLIASRTEEPCAFQADGAPTEPERCATESVAVAVHPPPRIELTADATTVLEGETATLHYAVTNAASFSLGLVEIVGGERRFRACVPASEAGDGAPCVLPESGGSVDTEGDVAFADVTHSFTFGAIAEGLAGDGVGDIAAGDLELTIAVEGAPTIGSFTVDDSTVRAGDTVTLQWTTSDSDGVSLSASPNNVVQSDLAGCTSVDAAGAGSCQVQIAAGAPEGDIVFSLVASAAGKPDSAPASQVVSVGVSPELTLGISPAELPEGGGAVTVSWSAPGALSARLVDDVNPGALLDTSDGTGSELCAGGADAAACEPEADAAEIPGVIVSTQYTLTVENEFGPTSATVAVSVAGQPAISTLALGGTDVLAGGPAIVDRDSADLSFTTANAASTVLERAPAPPQGCSPDLAWVSEASFSGATSGTEALADLTSHLCFRLSALGGGGQVARRTFRVVRTPEVQGFSVDDQTVTIGQALTLSWQTSNATSVSVSATPVGAVTQEDLAGCAQVAGDGTGSCTLSVQPGTPLGDVTFQLVAAGLEDTSAAPETTSVTVGVAPVLDSFDNNPKTIGVASDVTLSWASQDGARVQIHDDTGALAHETTTLSEVAAGSFVVSGVGATTTWTLTVSSEYGSAQAQVTTFFGPSFDVLTMNGDDASDGQGDVVTGDVTLAWETSNATSVEVFDAPAPAGGDCGALVADDFASLGASAADGSLQLAGVVEDRCLRLLATNAAMQESEVRALLKEHPEALSLSTTPGTITRSAGGTILVEMSLRGAEELVLVADYLNADGTVVGSSTVCTEASLNSGSLSGGAAVDDVSCSDTYDQPSVICVGCRLMPAAATAIRYRVTGADAEGDEAPLDTSGGGDVTVQ